MIQLNYVACRINKLFQISTLRPDLGGYDNGKLLISSDSSGNIYFWDLTDQNSRWFDLKKLDNVAPSIALQADGTVNDLRFSRDDSFLVSGGKSLHMWTMNNLGQPITLEGHEPLTFINRLDISEDNRTLVSASNDQTTRLWNQGYFILKTVFSVSRPNLQNRSA